MTVGWTKVTIENGKATAYYQNRPYREVPAESLFGRDRRSGLFPAGLRWLSPDHSTVILERPPAYHSMAYAPTYRDTARDHKIFRIPVPWQVYIVTHRGESTPALRAFCRPDPLNAVDDALFIYPLPNVGPDGSVCMHVEGQWPAFVQTKPTLAERTTFMINAMWMSGFNHNMGNIIRESIRHPEEFRDRVKGADNQILTALEAVGLDEVVKWHYPRSPFTPATFMGGGGGRKETGLVDVLAGRIMGASA